MSDDLEPFESADELGRRFAEEEPPPVSTAEPLLFEAVAKDLRIRGLEATAGNPGGLPVVVVNAGPEGYWTFGTSGGLLWGGDYYQRPGGYLDSIELKVRTDCTDPKAIADAIAARVAAPLESDLSEAEPPTRE